MDLVSVDQSTKCNWFCFLIIMYNCDPQQQNLGRENERTCEWLTDFYEFSIIGRPTSKCFYI
jgi:hypothetical protein